jgi:hypothetical protein
MDASGADGVDQDVETTQLLQGCFADRIGAFLGPDVAFNEDRVLRRFRMPIAGRYDDFGAAVDEALRCSSSDAARAPSDERALAGKFLGEIE